MSSRTTQLIVQVTLGILILVLSYVLYVSITEPYADIQAEQEVTQETRERMSQVRASLVDFRDEHDTFPPSLDSLLNWVRQDSAALARIEGVYGQDFALDSLKHSPRSGREFDYAVNDTAVVPTYLLEDPDSDDHIGTLAEDVTEINAASWE